MNLARELLAKMTEIAERLERVEAMLQETPLLVPCTRCDGSGLMAIYLDGKVQRHVQCPRCRGIAFEMAQRKLPE